MACTRSPKCPLPGERAGRSGSWDIGWLDALNPYYYDGSEENVPRTALEIGAKCLGAFIDGKLAGFIRLPSERGLTAFYLWCREFRRRGVGYALERHIIRFCFGAGAHPLLPGAAR